MIGIDPSINSTGICILKDKPIYYLITSKMTKKMKEINNDRINIIEYDYQSSTGLKSFEKEHSKSMNVYNICKEIEKIIDKYLPTKIYMEAVAFAANGTIDQLAGLNYSIRNIAINKGIDIIVIPPTTIKLLSVGNGQATKESIINTWKHVDPEMYDICKNIKCDDLADAYMIATIKI